MDRKTIELIYDMGAENSIIDREGKQLERLIILINKFHELATMYSKIKDEEIKAIYLILGDSLCEKAKDILYSANTEEFFNEFMKEIK